MKQKALGVAFIVLSLLLAGAISLVKADLDERDAVLCGLYHSTPDVDPTKCPVHTSNMSWYILAVYAIAFLVGIGGILLLIPRSGRMGEEHSAAPVDISRLEEDEQKICTLIQERDGSMYQSDLIKETGFSKVHMTRVLDRLEGKKVLERKRRGMTNIIVLK